MTDPNEWIKDLVPPEQVEQMETSSRRIVDGHHTVYEMTLMMSEEDMVTAVRTLRGMRIGVADSWMMGLSILTALIDSMEDALLEGGVDVDDYWGDDS